MAEGKESEETVVPQLHEFGITEQDLAVAIKVLDAVSSLDPKNAKKNKKRKAASDNDGQEQQQEPDGLSEFRKPNLRQFRKSLASCLSLHQQLMYDGKSEKEFYETKMAERTLKRQKMAERAQQKAYVAATNLRRGRVEKLEKLKEDSKEEEEAKMLQFLIPDGHVDTSNNNGVKLLVEDASDDNGDNEKEQSSGKVLPKLRSCYVCKVRFRILHHFYDQLCPDCAPFNYDKRNQTADLTGTVAIVTGSRVKIGFQVCLKLLRAGATVVATTRFPNNAVAAYKRESDFNEWSGRLHVYGLDLRDVTGLEAFTRYLKVTYKGGIDMLINNACQTVRRPAGYYLPLVERESDLWSKGDESHRNVLAGCKEFERIRRRLVVEQGSTVQNGNEAKLLPAGSNGGNLLLNSHSDSKQEKQGDAKGGELVSKESSSKIPFDTTGISHSAAMSQMAIIPEDVGIDEKVMPSGLSDINGHQVDLRTSNSWLLKMDQVSTPEIMECMFVNAIAPFVLNSRLTPLMEAPLDDPERPDRFIINVSAMEGKFYRYKMPNHPHTNMAKAALNMLTRTSSEELAKKSRIYMNSVDTGWINDENPLEKASKTAKANLFQTPIDEIDAAARILDPIISAKIDKSDVKYGCFFKDYKETEW
ncbi:short-chain dehydrogenase [Skeletonema marinoi]|uniref:Short-chain dehydrogenase n=1 Tax=Skeletonema marinoi TaxID=267567 RepID=A0AAD8YDN4_9STRA|nr:short-chain dehydrogenase [Skeletonema marinoi]